MTFSLHSRPRIVLLGVIAGLVVVRLVAGQFGEAEEAGGSSGDPLALARAQTQTAPDSEKPDSGSADQSAQSQGSKADRAGSPRFTEEEIKVLTELQQRREQMEKEREREDKTAERLEILRDKMGKDLDRLKRLRDQIQTGLDKEEQLRTDKMAHLVNVYSNMSPKKAAERIDRMDRKTAVKLLSQMKGEAAGRILSFVEPEKANEISQDMTGMVDEIE